MKNVVLVHGGFVDGAGWEGVYKILKKAGHNVSIVQNPTISLEDDVAVTKRILATLDAPAILVGHSYGGAVITEAGNDPKVAKLVYIAAFAPDEGESVSALIKNPPAGAPVPPILPPQDGYLFLDKAKFPASFAADVETDRAGGIGCAAVHQAGWAGPELPAYPTPPGTAPEYIWRPRCFTKPAATLIVSWRGAGWKHLRSDVGGFQNLSGGQTSIPSASIGGLPEGCSSRGSCTSHNDSPTA